MLAYVNPTKRNMRKQLQACLRLQSNCLGLGEPQLSQACFGMVWYGSIWFGMVWFGMVWYGLSNILIVKQGLNSTHGALPYAAGRSLFKKYYFLFLV